MEFWCLTKRFEDYDDYSNDFYAIHYKTEEEAIEDFNNFIIGYVESYELDESDFEYEEEENYRSFTLDTDFCSVNLLLERIVL